MNITFTKEQYETLLKAVYLGNWMVNAMEEDAPNEEFDALESYLFSFAGKFGLDHYAEYDENDKQYYPTLAFEEDPDVNESIQRYDEYTFWGELIRGLSSRDLIEECGEEAAENMPGEERLAKEQPIMEKYENEFATNGLKNLTVSGGK